MSDKLFQWNYEIEGLIPEQVRLERKVWLKEKEILLTKKNKNISAYVLGSEIDSGKQRVVPYLWMSCLISHNTPELSGGSGSSIVSLDKLGTAPIITTTFSLHLPEGAVRDIEQYTPKYLRFIGKLHDKYIDVIKENDFLSIALDYFYDAEKKSIYNDEGLISSMISLEALFNEGPFDIKYKLSHRAAFLMGLSGFDSLKAFKKLKEFYDDRSTLVHGGGNLKHDPDRYLVSKYTRRVLIIFMILLKNSNRGTLGIKKRKTSLLQEIDYAMLDESFSKSLKKEITEGLKDFNIKIPRTFEGKEDGRDYRITAW